MNPRRPTSCCMIFMKLPEAGRVKTRLAAEIGPQKALEVYRALVEHTLKAVMRPPGFKAKPLDTKGNHRDTIKNSERGEGGAADEETGWQYETRVFISEPGNSHEPARLDEAAKWLGLNREEVEVQRGGDLGEKMANAFETMLGRYERVAIIGTDLPDMSSEIVSGALRGLDEADMVLGPSLDGGYYLMALKRPYRELFADIEWSTPEVFGETMRRAEGLGLKSRLLETRRDIDTAEDLRHADFGHYSSL